MKSSAIVNNRSGPHSDSYMDPVTKVLENKIDFTNPNPQLWLCIIYKNAGPIRRNDFFKLVKKIDIATKHKVGGGLSGRTTKKLLFAVSIMQCSSCTTHGQGVVIIE